jgi:hypothetical protein
VTTRIGRHWKAAILIALAGAAAQDTPAEKLIAQGHWKRARALVEVRYREAPNDPLANFLMSQIRAAFGDRTAPMPFAEKAVALDGRTAKYHRQVAEVSGIMAEHANLIQQVLLARRFRKEIDAALALDSRDVQAWRDQMEFDLLAPGVVGGDPRQAAAVAARIGAIDPAEGFLAQARIAEFHKQPAETEKFLRQAVDADPASYRARVALARFYASADHFHPADATREAERAIALDRGRADAYSVLAEVAARQADFARLDTVLAEAEAQVPDDLTPYYRAAEVLLATHRDKARTERYLRAYLGQEPEGNEPSAADARRLLRDAQRLTSAEAS